MQLTKNFILQEFVSQNTYHTYGEKSIMFLDMRMVTLAQFFVDHFGKPMTVNNWNAGGKFNERGYRDPVLSSVGAARSQHKFGRGFDGNLQDITPQEVYEEVMNNQQKFYDAGLRCMEDIDFTKGWNHCDIRETIGHGIKPGQILIVKP